MINHYFLHITILLLKPKYLILHFILIMLINYFTYSIAIVDINH